MKYLSNSSVWKGKKFAFLHLQVVNAVLKTKGNRISFALHNPIYGKNTNF